MHSIHIIIEAKQYVLCNQVVKWDMDIESSRCPRVGIVNIRGNLRSVCNYFMKDSLSDRNKSNYGIDRTYLVK